MPTLIPVTNTPGALVDDADVPLVSRYHWHSHKGYAATCAGGHPHRKTFMHRLICQYPTGQEVDHINGDKLDNQRSNLRPATRYEQMQNAPRHRDSSSPYKGITLDHRNNHYLVRIMHHGHITYLGQYAIAEDAAHTYDQAARQIHGEFARCNFEEETHDT